MTQKKVTKINQKNEDLAAFLNYLLVGDVESKEQAEQVNKAARRSATVSDATVVARAVAAQIDNKITQLMEVVQIQSAVLEKLGATEEMFVEAEQEYNEKIEQLRKEIEARNAAEKEEAEPVQADVYVDDELVGQTQAVEVKE
jgi:hypothetical protein